MKPVLSFFNVVPNFRFIRLRAYAFSLSAFIVFGSFLAVGVFGLNFGIDFKGGLLIEARTEQPFNLGDLRRHLNNLSIGDVSLQEFGDKQTVLVRVPTPSGGETAVQPTVDRIKETMGTSWQYRRVEFVGPQIGGELIHAGVLAVILSMAGIMAYIWFRFEWHFAVSAMLALVHDVIGIIGIFAITQMEFNLSTVAAVLLVAGYSINDTVVVFDRVRENLRKYKSIPLTDLLDLTVNETLSRTILTSGTTLMALSCLWLFGGEAIRGFVFALILGIVTGTYSSVYVASPLFMMLRLGSKKS
jgi:preprotein translocase subunit SecF